MVSILSAIKYNSVLIRIYYKAFHKEVRLVYKIDLKQFNDRQKISLHVFKTNETLKVPSCHLQYRGFINQKSIEIKPKHFGFIYL